MFPFRLSIPLGPTFQNTLTIQDAGFLISPKRKRPTPPTLDTRLSPPATLPFPCRRISLLMHEHGHELFAPLKMDIEGSEYEVLTDILCNTLEGDQILVGFHHRFPGVGMQKTLDATAAMKQSGYRLFHVSPCCEEFAFIRS